MDISIWGRQLRQVQTCESRDIHILGILYYICIIIIIEEKKINIVCFSFTINWTRKMLSRGVWYLLPNLDSGWASEGIIFLVQFSYFSINFTYYYPFLSRFDDIDRGLMCETPRKQDKTFL